MRGIHLRFTELVAVRLFIMLKVHTFDPRLGKLLLVTRTYAVGDKSYLLRLCWTEDDHTGYLRTYKDRFRTAINKYKVLLFIKVFCVFCFS